MKRNFSIYITFLIAYSLPCLTYAQVVINEVCSANKTVIEDEYGESSDWIELYNTGDEQLDLEGWTLSDKLDENDKWQFPNISIQARSFLLVFASGLDLLDVNPHTNFKLSADGEILTLSNPQGDLIDQVNIPALEDDISYGRNNDSFQYFSEPTPGQVNQAEDIIKQAKQPRKLEEGHFFNESTFISFKCEDPNCNIYYSLDGDDPSDNSKLYNGPIKIDTTTCLRAISIAPKLLPSIVETNTIFINTDHSIPIVSLSANPEEYYSEENGILVPGLNGNPDFPYFGSNFWLDREVKANFEYFENNKKVHEQIIDTREHGGTSARTNPQKALRLVAEQKYGKGTINYPFFEGRTNSQHKAVILRNASGDFNNGHLRDAFLSRYYQRSGLHVDILAHQPVAIYINGAYYGLINLREKSDEDYIANLYGLDAKNIDILEEDTIVVNGNFDEFDRMYEYVISNDLSISSNYKQAGVYFDLENIAEYFIVQTGLNNNDCLHNNIKYWRERRKGAKWRYIVFDLDLALNRKPWSKYDYNLFLEKMTLYQGTNKHVNIFKALLANEEFKNYFLNRHADLFNTVFKPELFKEELDISVLEIENEMVDHLQRWPTITYTQWQEEKLPILYKHIDRRPDFAAQYLIDYFKLTKSVALHLTSSPLIGGKIKINTITPETLPWKGDYFDGVPVTLVAVPNLGYRFSHWDSSAKTLDLDTRSKTEINFAQGEDIIAHYTLIENEEPYIENVWWDGQSVQVRFGVLKASDVGFEIYDALGRKVHSSAAQNFTPGIYNQQILLNSLASGVYFFSIKDGSKRISQSFAVAK